MKLHLLSNPNQPTGLGKPTEAFSVIIYKFIENLRSHFELVHYGLEGSQVRCEHVDLPRDERGFHTVASQEIDKRKSPDDIVLCFWGVANQPAVQAHSELKIVEPSIGYHPDSVFAPFRVFASYANMHYFYGKHGNMMDPSWFDAVIHNPIDPNDFDYTEDKDDYFLMFGRVCDVKGVHIAIQAAQAANKRLVIVGPGDNGDPSWQELGYQGAPAGNIELRGPVMQEERRQLMARAQGLIAPTKYLEPFGNMVAEAHMSGTPTITTDWGAFPENNIHGVTGYRCRMFGDFVWAMENLGEIRPSDCYQHAVENFSDAVVFAKYQRYFQALANGNFYQTRMTT